MNWTERLSRLFRTSPLSASSRKQKSPPPRSRRVAVEPLEDRCLLSVSPAAELAGAAGEYDFGDAPDNYGTTLAANAAYHEAVGPTLGATRDAESDGLPTTAADGDDADGTDDEDGVTFGTIQVGQLDAMVTVNVQNVTTTAVLDAWIDFNGDGSFGGADEHIAASVSVSEGDNVIEFDVPSTVVSGEVYARFRLSTDGDLPSTGAAADGEVEDYQITLSTIANDAIFATGEEITDYDTSFDCVVTADLDGDGDTDVISVSTETDILVWHENDGAGNFTDHIISSTGDLLQSVYAADLNGDGHMDVVAGGRNLGVIVWYENDGDANFTKHTISACDDDSTVAVSVADINGDGNVDVLAAYYHAGKIAWCENDGLGNFTEHVLSITIASPNSIAAADVDGDGNVDILATSKVDDAVLWYKNDGNGEFIEHTIASDVEDADNVCAADLNDDGRLDILATAGYASSLRSGKIAWYEQAETGAFTEHLLDTPYLAGLALCTADMNGDGRLDVVYADTVEWTISDPYFSYLGWFRNEGNGEFTDLSISPTNVPRSLAVGDLDGDGLLDVLCASRNLTVVWYENLDNTDFGDAPDSYGTSLEQDGAQHGMKGPTLGATRDSEEDGKPSSAANGDDADGTDDEDGVTLSSDFVPGQCGEIAVVNVQNASEGACLDAWIDFNGNGSFDDEGEQIASSFAVVEGDNVLWALVPTDAVVGTTYARFRLSTTGGLNSTGIAADGEVEDYVFTINAASTGTIADVTFSSVDELYATLAGTTSLVAADINGDGAIDLAGASKAYDKIAWYENDGNGAFVAHTITTSAGGAASVFVADLNGDGYQDIVFASEYDDTLGWYENDGNQVFVEHIIDSETNGIDYVIAADIDADGDMDILASISDPDDYTLSSEILWWYRNDGNEQFDAKIVAIGLDNVTAIAAEDMDGDGLLDIVSVSDGTNSSDAVRWFRNTGNGGFTNYEVSERGYGAETLAVADVNGDGLLDIITSSTIDNTLSWFANDGNLGFTEHIITTEVNDIRALCAGDIDGDGDGDIVAASYEDDWVLLYENDGGEVFSETVVDSLSVETQAVLLEDLNNDGAIDIACGNREGIVWYENGGAASFTKYGITYYSSKSSAVVDVNGDGLLDVVAGGLGSLYWHENTGDSNFVTRIVASFPNAYEYTDSAVYVGASDFNNDGNMDLVAVSGNGGMLTWYENDGTETFTAHIIDADSGSYDVLLVTDLDDDGLSDIVTGQYGSITWYKNQGEGSFFEHSVATEIGSVFSLDISDVNGDGYLDIVRATYSSSILWYENDGEENFTERAVTTSAERVYSVAAADFNNDGYMDLVASLRDEDKVVWYKNDGSENFTEYTITTGFSTSRCTVVVADVDGDGYNDVMTSWGFQRECAWYRNNGEGSFVEQSFGTDECTSTLTGVDLDGDSDLDVVATYRSSTFVLWNTTDQWDFGDAPDSYGTTLASNGARHGAEGPVLGVSVDWESNGSPSASADGDDLQWSDDDDGVVFDTGIWAGRAIAEVTVTASAAGYLDAWIDFDGNGTFDADEQIADSVSVHAGENVLQFTVPDSAVAGESYARFRLSSSGNLSAIGEAADGEVEDYLVTILPDPDFGDAPDSYGTTLAADGAHHAGTGPTLGSSRDSELDGVASSDATGDDTSDSDDEDGVTFDSEILVGQLGVSLTVNIQNASEGAKLDAWIDFNGDGVFADDERIANGLSVSEGDNLVTFDVPLSAVAGDTFARFRVSTVGNLAATGPADDGEVEDYTVTIVAPTMDYGDAPDSYGTTLDSNGARHLGDGPTLGMTRDLDADGLPTSEADGDDLYNASDEDGVTFGNNLVVGRTGREITVNVPNASSGAKLDAWIDFNGDGVFGSDEQIADSIDVVQGDNTITFDVPESAVPGTSYARFRLSTAGDLDPTGLADDGEVEDYAVAIYSENLELTRVDLGTVDFLELSGIDLSSESRAYSLSTMYGGYLTIAASLDSSGGEATLRLIDSDEEVIAELTTENGYAKIDRLDLVAGTAYALQVTGTNSDVTLKFCNLVEVNDTAVTVHGTAADDAFTYASGQTHALSINGIDYEFALDAITTVDFDGGEGTDSATLTGSAGNETAAFYPGHGAMTTTDSGFVASVESAEDITLNSGGGLDVVELEDSDGDDTLVATTAQMTLTGTPVEGSPYSLTANNFRYAHAYARNGGDDTATLEGSEGYDRIKAYPDFVRLFNSSFYNRVKFFDTVAADTLGGDDHGVMLASDNADVVWAMKDDIRLAQNVELGADETPDYDTLAYNVTIAGCAIFTARADGGDDWIELHDSAGKDVLIAKPHKIMMMNGPTSSVARGEEYTITARGFTHMASVADQGGDYDAAKLYDSSEDGTDIWAAAYSDGETWSTMTSPSRLLYEVTAFEQVGGYGFNGGFGEDYGANTKDHAEDVDFVFQYGYWE